MSSQQSLLVLSGYAFKRVVSAFNAHRFVQENMKFINFGGNVIMM